MYMTYMHVIFFLVHNVLADILKRKEKRVAGRVRGPASHLSLAEQR